MAVISIIIALAVLAVMLMFMLGWLWPLVAGMCRRKKGQGGTVLIFIGSAWGACSMILAGLLVCGLVIYARTFSQRAPKSFDLEGYSGPTARILAGTEGDAVLTASSGQDGRFSFRAEQGVFTVPAGKLELEACSITETDDSGNVWSASWSYYGAKKEVFDLAEGSEQVLRQGEPFIMRVNKNEMADGNIRLDIEILDRTAREISLSSSVKPAVQIVDESGAAVWSRSLSYG